MTRIIKNSLSSLFLILSLLLLCSATLAAATDTAEVRNTVQRIFNDLKAGQYGELYDSLPSSSRGRVTRDRFVEELQRTRNLFQLERIEIGAVRVVGNLAVVDTVMYAHIAAPFDADGKLVVQQYLVREDGSWRVATGDRATIDLLKNNPAFGRNFQVKRPQAFIKKDGKWVAFSLRG
jgi:hypothetical protein